MALRQVVVGVDGSLSAVRALDRASEEAVLRGAALNILYAVPDADIAGPVLASSALRVRNRHPGLAFTSVAVVDSPVRALLRHGQDAELTVVGSRGLGGIVGLVAGSVSRRLAARIRGPLLVVRGGRADPEGEVLLWPSGAADLDAAAFAFAEADFRGSASTSWLLRPLRTWSPVAGNLCPTTARAARRAARGQESRPSAPSREEGVRLRNSQRNAACWAGPAGPLSSWWVPIGHSIGLVQVPASGFSAIPTAPS